MACACGRYHTITLSSDGVIHSFGRNYSGELGLGHNNNVSLPSLIHNIPKIKQVSCGRCFTVCVDDEGFLWSFGENSRGQLGINSTTNSNVPEKVLKIPPVLSVACGREHTLIIANDSYLWSCGNNNYGQLCLGNQKDQKTFTQTFFSHISKISAGMFHSLFQNYKGEIFSCGHNSDGRCGLGHFRDVQIKPTLIPNLPLNIVEFICGGLHNLFLDWEGNVYSVGYNRNGQLGLGHNENQNVLNQIPNIPPIQSIFCTSSSSYLIDIEANVWSFGFNDNWQLGHGDSFDRNAPTKSEYFKDIQQVSYGCCAIHFLAKDSQNTIFVLGCNTYGKLGTKSDLAYISFPKEMDPEYFPIWGEIIRCKAKSARK